jgi:hypothetical protein
MLQINSYYLFYFMKVFIYASLESGKNEQMKSCKSGLASFADNK